MRRTGHAVSALNPCCIEIGHWWLDRDFDLDAVLMGSS
jgi:hypothetical protein